MPKKNGTTPCKDRLRQIVDETGLKPAQFARAIGISRAAVSYMLQGKSNCSGTTAKVIENTFGYNANWILTGEAPVKTDFTYLSLARREAMEAILNMSESEVEAVVAFIRSLHSCLDKVKERKNA